MCSKNEFINFEKKFPLTGSSIAIDHIKLSMIFLFGYIESLQNLIIKGNPYGRAQEHLDTY